MRSIASRVSLTMLSALSVYLTGSLVAAPPAPDADVPALRPLSVLAPAAKVGTGGALRGVAFDDTGERIVVPWTDGIARVLRVADGAELTRLKPADAATQPATALRATAVAFSPDGTQVVTGSTYAVPADVEGLQDVGADEP